MFSSRSETPFLKMKKSIKDGKSRKSLIKRPEMTGISLNKIKINVSCTLRHKYVI